MKFIQQRNEHDCGVAAIAMFLDKTYEEVLERLSTTPYYEDDEDSSKTRYVYKEGYGTVFEDKYFSSLEDIRFVNLHQNCMIDYYDSRYDIFLIQRPQTISYEYFRNIAWGRRALIEVKSLNVEGGFHFIAYDGKDVFDPQRDVEGKKWYTKFSEIQPLYFYIMRQQY